MTINPTINEEGMCLEFVSKATRYAQSFAPIEFLAGEVKSNF